MDPVAIGGFVLTIASLVFTAGSIYGKRSKEMEDMLKFKEKLDGIQITNSRIESRLQRVESELRGRRSFVQRKRRRNSTSS